MSDWFRKITWTESDRADFFARLARARGAYQKAQYLRIQAVHLQHTGQLESVRAALELLDILIADYPEPSEIASAHMQRGECLSTLGDPDAGLTAHREALAAERKMRTIKTDAYLGFGELVLYLERTDLYPEALSILDEFGGAEWFPVQRYRSAALRAIVFEHLGQLAEAREFAERALVAAAATESPFRYHRALGLVTDTGTELHGRLLALAGRTH
jgi:tetratricopeptide (TPR) repeat protein